MWGQPIAAPAEATPEPAPVRVVAPPISVGAGRQLRALQASLPVIRDADPDPAGLEGLREELGAPMPRIKPANPASDWTLEKALSGHLINTFSEYAMFLLLNVWMQFDRKVQKMAQEVVSANFSVPAASS